ncbi:MAG TPA: substrate-binding domain-containing protein [Mycobacteriales bacterium]|jgi:ABC-type phosphate transport system substrate-binding protein|nr:substrate-binding domain-containing protein [Mycobacteriales bacterium]
MCYSKRSVIASAALGFVLAATVAGAPAFATDPAAAPAAKDLVGVGSDTAQDVMGLEGSTLAKSGFGPRYNATKPASRLWGYDVTGSASITPKKGCAAIARPNGSGAGIAAVKADEAAKTHCVDYARSSRPKVAATDGDLLFVPYARDGVSWATFPVSGTRFNAPANLTTAQLNSIYTCAVTNWNQVGGASAPISAYLPQATSGTRSFFLGAIGVTSPGACVKQPSALEENSGAGIPAADRPAGILPYSIAKWIAQKKGVSKDNRAGAVLRNVDGKASLTTAGALNAKFAPKYLRLIYNVVKPADKGAAAFSKVFSKKGYLCKHPAVVTAFGFAALPAASCGY